MRAVCVACGYFIQIITFLIVRFTEKCKIC
uniref:Uncharacterized protein n=1 Tax=Siphoviridae sp. ctA995 TaxID=2826180 RepID=A0A8S5LYD8_9CAUD|nr:MAG TPA: hypothetical protein [Siphoviridae sp. ctA995]